MRAFLLASLLLIIAMAGCLGGDDDVDPEDNGDGQPKGTSGLGGRILNEESLDPIADVRLRLILGEEVVYETHSDVEGYYLFDGVVADTYRLQASHACCDAFVGQVTLDEDELAQKDIMLEPLLDQVVRRIPWDERNDFTGFFSCAINAQPAYPSILTPCAETDESHTSSARGVAPDVGLRSVIVGLTWDEAGVFGANEFTLVVRNTVGGSGFQYANLTAGSPIEIRIDNSELSGDQAFEFFDDEDTPSLSLEFRVIPPTGIIYQQPYTLHWWLFYWDEAPSGATALPDA